MELEVLEQDENFYFIAGYTEGGFPFGITWEEYEAEKKGSGTEESLPLNENALDRDEF